MMAAAAAIFIVRLKPFDARPLGEAGMNRIDRIVLTPGRAAASSSP